MSPEDERACHREAVEAHLRALHPDRSADEATICHADLYPAFTPEEIARAREQLQAKPRPLTWWQWILYLVAVAAAAVLFACWLGGCAWHLGQAL